MIGTILLGKVFTNKWVWIGIIGLGLITGAYMKGRSDVNKNALKETVKIVKKYVKKKDALDRKYSGNIGTDECILSGCVPEEGRKQDHCRACK